MSRTEDQVEVDVGAGTIKVRHVEGGFAPEPMTDEEERQLRDQADIEGPLVDWKAKGHQVVLSGKKSLDGREVYELHVTLRHGRVLRQYLDARSFLLHRTESTRLVRGHPVEVEATFDDYRKVEGILIPHAIVTGAIGRPQRLNVVVEEVVGREAVDGQAIDVSGARDGADPVGDPDEGARGAARLLSQNRVDDDRRKKRDAE